MSGIDYVLQYLKEDRSYGYSSVIPWITRDSLLKDRCKNAFLQNHGDSHCVNHIVKEACEEFWQFIAGKL